MDKRQAYNNRSSSCHYLMNVNVSNFDYYLLLYKLLKIVPLLHLSLWTFQVFRAMTQAKVLMRRSWATKKASSPHEPSGSWFLAIQSMHEGNSGPSPPSSFLTSAIHAVSYREISRSPPAADLNEALMEPIISSMFLGSPFYICREDY